MKRNLIFLLVLILILSACQQNDSQNTVSNSIPTEVVLQTGLGVIKGQINLPEEWDNRIIYSYAAPYLGDPEGEGIFILDDKVNQFSEIDPNGNFVINNVPPGIFILVVGPDPETAIAYRIEGIAIKYEVLSDEILDIGLIEIAF